MFAAASKSAGLITVGWLSYAGPAVGAQIVTAGAAELSGTEFGFAK